VSRSSEMIGPDRVRFTLRAVAIKLRGRDSGVEVTREYDTSFVRDKLSLGQSIPTAEDTFEQLWQQLRLDLDIAYGD
jgi:hypothetical protein